MSKGHSPRKYNPRKWNEGYERAFEKPDYTCIPPERWAKLIASPQGKDYLPDHADMLRAEIKDQP